MAYFEPARFTGDAVYYVKLEGRVIYPVDGTEVIGKVIRKNKMGLYVNYRDAIRIQVPRDLHLGNMEYDSVEVGDTVLIEMKRSRFAINDPHILATGVFRSKEGGEAPVVARPALLVAANPEAEKSDVEEEEQGDEKEEL
jgi:hypothetical protein